jgi:hypothetical protein
MRVRDLPGWVPQPGGARSTGERVPRPNEVFIERVLQVFNDNLIFTCRFVDNFSGKPEGRSVFYSFPVLEKETLPKIAEIINQNVGKTLLSIGDIEIPSD